MALLPIMMGFQARRIILSGSVPMELAILASDFMKQVKKHGIEFTVRWESS
jgi:hypothetical protein